MMVFTFPRPATTPGVVACLFPPLKQVLERSCSLPEPPPQPSPTPLILPDRRRWRLSSRTDQTPPTQIEPIHSDSDPVSPHLHRLAGIDLAGVIASDPFWVSHCAAHHCQAPVHVRLALAAAMMPDPDPNSRAEPTLEKPDRRGCTVGGETGYFWQKVQVGPWTFPDLTEVPDSEFCAKSAPKVGFGWFWFRDGFLKGGVTNDLDSKALQTGRGRAKSETRQDPTTVEDLFAVEEGWRRWLMWRLGLARARVFRVHGPWARAGHGLWAEPIKMSPLMNSFIGLPVSGRFGTALVQVYYLNHTSDPPDISWRKHLEVGASLLVPWSLAPSCAVCSPLLHSAKRTYLRSRLFFIFSFSLFQFILSYEWLVPLFML